MKKTKYIHYRDLFKILTYEHLYTKEDSRAFSKEDKDYLYGIVYDGMVEAAEHGFYEAYYFIGMMNLNGLYTKKNIKKAYFNFCVAASYGHALSYFELYKMYSFNFY
jgi:TPR repeat protein